MSIYEFNEEIRGKIKEQLEKENAALEDIIRVVKSYGKVKEVSNKLEECKRYNEQSINCFERVFERINLEDELSCKKMEELTEKLSESHKIIEKAKETFSKGWENAADMAGIIINVYDATMEHIRSLIDALYEKYAEDGDMDALKNGLEKYTSCYSIDPVNLATGNLIYNHEDIRIKGGSGINFTRYYNSKSEYIGALGSKWQSNYEARIEFKDEKAIHIVLEDGNEECYVCDESGIYYGLLNNRNQLVYVNEQYIYTTNEQKKYIFNKAGKLLEIKDANGIGFNLIYADEKLIKAVGTYGENLEMKYDGERLVSVTDQNGRVVHLRYKNDLLSEVSNANGETRKYEYSKDGILNGIINADGIKTLSNTFDEKGRTVKQVFPDHGEMLYTYDDENRKVTLTEQNGNHVVYEHDKYDRIVKIEYSDGSEEYEYNKSNLKSAIKDKRGNRSTMQYDNRGNVTKLTNAIGESTIITYNIFNKPCNIKDCGGGETKFSYDQKGNPTKIKDAQGNTVTVGYNASGKPIKVTAADGSQKHLAYDVRGNITEINDAGRVYQYKYDKYNRVCESVDGNGHKTTYEYDIMDRLVYVTNAEGKKRGYEYNRRGKVVKIIDFDGSTLRREYNNLGKPCVQTDQSGNETKFYYDKMWNVTKRVDANNAETSFIYNKLNRLETVIDPLGKKTEFEYDANGNRTRTRLPNGAEQRVEYDALNRASKIMDSNGGVKSIEYNYLGKPIKLIDECGNIYSREYDELGNVIRSVNPVGEEIRYSYTALGKIREINYGGGRKKSYEYYQGGLLKKFTDIDGSITEYKYDGNGNVVVRDKNGLQTRYQYDSLDRIVRIINADNTFKQFAYDAVGNITAVCDENGGVTKYRYSPTGKIIEVIDAMGARTVCSYDSMDEVVQFTRCGSGNSSRDQITRYTRDLMGRVTKVIDPLGNEESYEYDEIGNITSKIDYDGFMTKYDYDAESNLTGIQYADGKAVKMSYNPLKQLVEIQDWLGVTTIVPDALGRALKVTDYANRTVEYEWGAMGERKSMIYPNGKRVDYNYNAKGQLEQLLDESGAVSYGYDEHSRLNQKLYPNGAKANYSYNTMGNLAGIVNYSGQNITDILEFSYDKAGNRAGTNRRRSDVQSSGNRYEYDAVGRLVGVFEGENRVQEYRYDEFGNRIYSREGLEATNYYYNNLNQLIRTEHGGHIEDYSYDKRGNIVKKVIDGAVDTVYNFDVRNLLSSVETSAGKETNYYYNGLGKRIGQVGTEGRVDDIIDLTKDYNNLLIRRENNHVQSFTWDYNVVSASDSSGANYYLNDELGSPMRVMDSVGRTKAAYSFSEFGSVKEKRGSYSQPFGYTGYQYDNTSNLYFAQARYYDPALGRFVSEDRVKGNIIRPDTINPYIYCLCNPLKYVDFDGNEEKDVDAIMITYYESTSHTSLLVQNENGDWYFFFWGPENSNPYPAALPCGTEAKPTFEKIINKDIIDEESGTVNLDLLNSYLEESEIYTGYKFDSYVYYDGDYSKTYRYLNDYVEKDELDDYNLYFNNCSDVSVRALLLGEGMSVFERFMLLMYCSGVLTIPRIVDIIARFTHDNTQCFS